MAKKAPVGTKVTKQFEFALTEAEFAAKGKGAAALCKEIRDLEVKFDGIKEDWKAKIKDREAKRDELLTVIHAQKELRTLDSVMVKNFEAKQVEYFVEVEGKWTSIEVRSMTENEVQMEMALEKQKKPRASKPSEKHDPVAAAHANGKDHSVADVVKEETSRRTKLSAVDGPRA